MSLNLTELQQTKGSLRRAPPPKAPPNKASPPRSRASPNKDNVPSITQSIPGVKLKKTGFRASLIADDGDFKLGHAEDHEPENELLRKIKQRRALVEQTEQKVEEEMKPRPKPKPKPKPHIEGKENERKLSSSSDDGAKENKENSIDINKNVVCRDSKGEPKLSFLPTLESLGKPPAKPIKVEGLETLLQKYSRADIVIAQRRSTLTRNIESSIDTTALDNVIAEDDEFAQEDYDDVDEDLKAQILGHAANGAQEAQPTAEEDSGILEENYDDVDEIKEKVNKINQNLDGAQNNEPICEESYDDLDTVVEQAQLQLKNDFSGEGETFGEEMYEALPGEEDGITNGVSNGSSSVDNGSDSPVQNKASPSASPSAQIKEKGKKDLRKEMEMQKKREREEQKRKKEEEKRREREEREEKKRKEEEKKKREREDKELRKKHKLKPGNEGSGVGEAKNNFAGDGKFELPAKERETLFIISEKGCPSGKWLVKNTEGHLGYIPIELIQLKIDSAGNQFSAVVPEDQDFYEDVDKYQSAGQIEEEPDDQEVYDDIAGQEPIDEDLYEELPAD